MMERKKINCESYINILFPILIFIFCLWNLGILNRIRVIDDEFGYWGIAATFAGYDWHDLLSVTEYYSFGYSLILTPLMLLGKAGVSMAVIYKLAIVLNAVLLVGQYFLILYIFKELEIPLPAPLKQIAALFSTLYIGNVAQMNNALTEIYLCFMFWCIIALLIRTMKRYGYGNAFLLIAATANIFAIHMRAVGVVIAVIIVLAGWLITHYKECGAKYICFVIGVSGTFAVITGLLKQFVSNHIYMGGNVDSVNDIAANVSKARGFMSVGGIVDVAMSVLGKLYYAGVASFLLATVGLILSLVMIAKALLLRVKSKQAAKWQSREWILVFIFLAFMSEIGISAIFQCFSYYGNNATSARGDTITYGRYSDFVVGSVMLLGIWGVYRITEYYREAIVSILFLLVCAVSVQRQFNILSFYNGGKNLVFRGTGVPWLSFLSQGRDDNFAYYAASISIAVFLGICLVRVINVQKTMFFGIVLLSISLFWGIWSIPNSKAYAAAKSNKEKTVCTVQEIVDAAGKSAPVYLISRGGAPGDVKILQWCMGNQSIHMLALEELENHDLTQGIYLADSGDPRVLGMLSDRIDYVYDSGTIAVFASERNEKYLKIGDKAAAMGQAVNPIEGGVDLAQAATELSYQKENGSLYYNYQTASGGYMTWETDLELDDGVYEFEVDIRMRDTSPDSEIGYITVGTDTGEVQDTYLLSANDFAEKDRQIIPVQVTIKDWQEPVIGVYTYGEASIRIYDISYHKVKGNIVLDTEEWDGIADEIRQQDEKAAVYYVDSDGSGVTGFPYREAGNLQYLSGAMLGYKESFEQGYYIAEKTDMEILALCTEKMTSLQETEHYVVFEVK